MRIIQVGVRIIQVTQLAGTRAGAQPVPAGGRSALLATLSDTLAAHGGTIGILRDQAPPPLDRRPGVDVVVVSTENTLT